MPVVGSVKVLTTGQLAESASPVTLSKITSRSQKMPVHCAGCIFSARQRRKPNSLALFRVEFSTLLWISDTVRLLLVSTLRQSSPRNLGRQVYIPVGFAHGFLTLVDNVEVMYKVSNYYAPAHDSGIRWDDPDIAVPWPRTGNEKIISDKDRSLPLLKDFTSPFTYEGHPLEPLQVIELG